MDNKTNLLISAITAAFLLTTSLQAEENFISEMVHDVNLSLSKDTVVIPFVFSTESTGFAGGAALIKQGLFQPQTTLITSLMYGATQDIITNGQPEEANFKGGFISFSNYKLPFTNRTFFSLIGLKSYFPSATSYLRNGSNTSNEDNALVSSGNSDFLNTTFRYVMPIGEGLDNPERLYTLQNGFAMNREGLGGGVPFETGFTSLGIRTFYQHETYENLTDSPLSEWNTQGLKIFLEHDNTDYDLNPSRGYNFLVQYSKDFGNADSLQGWDFMELKYSHYFNLDTFSFTQQNVLALNMWTAYSPSWENDVQIDGLGVIDANRPPPWEGARLGGYNRMRGYDNNRFSDKASFYATAEYRAVLDWNPFRNNEYIPVAVDWFQVVAFVEAGRVNDEYNFDLLTDMKYDAGISLRAMAAQIPVRVDIAYGDEGANFWVMVYQPFDF